MFLRKAVTLGLSAFFLLSAGTILAQTGSNTNPVIEIEVDNGSGRGTQSNPLPPGFGIIMDIKVTPPVAIPIFGVQWFATKTSGIFCPGQSPGIKVIDGDNKRAGVSVPLLRTPGTIDLTLSLATFELLTLETTVWVAGDPQCGAGDDGGGDKEIGEGPTISSLTASPTSVKPGGTISLTATANNPQGESLTFRWFVNSTLLGNVFIGGKGTLFKTQTSTSSSTASFIVTPTLGERDLFFTLEVLGNTSGKLVSQGLTVLVRNGGSGGDPNPPPAVPTPEVCTFQGAPTIEVDAGPESTQILEGSTFQLNGNAFFPPVGGSIIPSDFSFTWSIVSSGGLNISLANSSTAQTSFVAPLVEKETTIRLKLTAKNNADNNSCSDEIEIKILDSSSNQTASASASANPSIAFPGDTVILSGSGSVDPEGDPLTFSWQASGANPAFVSLIPVDSNQREVRFVAPALATDSSFSFTLTVSDGNSQDTAVVTVLVLGESSISASSPKQCSAGTQGLTVDAGSKFARILEGNVFTLKGSAVNPNQGGSVIPGETPTFQWTVISHNGLNFIIQNSTQAEASFVAPQVSADTDVTIRLTAKSGSLSCSDDVVVRIQNKVENRPPQATASAQPSAANVGQVVLLRADSSTDPDSGDTLTFSWELISPASLTVSLKTVAEDESQVSFVAPSLEVDTILTFRVTVADSEFEDAADVSVLIKADESLKTASSLVFPFRALIPGSSTGVALLNPSNKEARLSFSAVDAEGGEIMLPQEEVLPPGGQLPKQTPQFLGEDPENASVLRVQSNRNLEGFFSHQTERGLDGVSRLDLATELYLPYAPRQISDEFVEIFVHNPTGPTRIRIKLFDMVGVLQGEVPLDLPSGGSTRTTLDQLFENLNEFGPGYLKIESDNSKVLAYEIFGNQDGFAALTGQRSLIKSKLVAPIFAISEDSNSEIRVINTNKSGLLTGPNDFALSYQVFRSSPETSELLYETPAGESERILKIGEMEVLDIRAFLEEKGLWSRGDGLLTGHFIVQLKKVQGGIFNTTNTVSAIAFQLTSGSLAALPMQDEGLSEGRVLQVAEGNFGSISAFTGIALFNPSDKEEARAHFELFNEEGTMEDEADLNVLPGEKVSKLVSEIFPRFRLGEIVAQIGGNIKVTAFKAESGEELSKLVVFSLFSVGDSLAAVEVLEAQPEGQ